MVRSPLIQTCMRFFVFILLLFFVTIHQQLHSNLSFSHMVGVVISIVSEKNGEGYALLLDGSTFEEIARAKFPYGLPYGLHGCWVPKD